MLKDLRALLQHGYTQPYNCAWQLRTFHDFAQVGASCQRLWLKTVSLVDAIHELDELKFPQVLDGKISASQ